MRAGVDDRLQCLHRFPDIFVTGIEWHGRDTDDIRCAEVGHDAAGDQLYADLDVSVTNLPTGTRLLIGDAVLEVTAAPHTGCSQFKERFGVEALRLTATPDGRELRLRGINTRVVAGGQIRPGDTVRVERPA